MCCFSVARPVGLLARLFPRAPIHVSRTSIFARMLGGQRQALAYALDLASRREVAMVLPLPIARGAGEDAVTFVDLSETPRMFEELARLFPLPLEAQPKGGPLRFSGRPQTLTVHKVGAFVASYVPTRADFTRLDRRFRLPEVLFDAVPAYADHGFAVFQLEAGTQTVHPMALTFPTRDPARLFFPTVHVHDGRFHTTATFDHTLYYQRAGLVADGEHAGDGVSSHPPDHTYRELASTEQLVARRVLRGQLPNEDTWIGGSPAGSPGEAGQGAA
jgi:hypothetical protein